LGYSIDTCSTVQEVFNQVESEDMKLIQIQINCPS
jgi:hypothetical protein